MVVVKNPVFNAYGLQKAIMFGLSSIVADYLGNFLFDTAKIKKELGMFDYEDILFEPLISLSSVNFNSYITYKTIN